MNIIAFDTASEYLDIALSIKHEIFIQYKEIGLLRALGATKKQIKNQIITQAAITGSIGAIIGTVLGTATSKLIDILAIPELQTLAYKQNTIFNITTTHLTLTIIIGVTISVLSAYIPAIKASNISPVKTLK